MYYLYILNCDNAFFYTGITNNIERRLKEHQNGEEKYTCRFNVLELVYQEKFQTRNKAEMREQQIKGWSKKKKKALIDGNPDQLKILSKSRS